MKRKAIVWSIALVMLFLFLSAWKLRSLPTSGFVPAARPRSAIEDALGSLRPGEGRWTGLGFAPLQEGKLTELSRSPEFRKSVAESLQQKETTPESIRNRALLSLVSGDASEAVLFLEEGIKKYPRDATLYNDQAAVHLYRAQAEKDPYQLILALAAIRRAVVLDGSSPEAAFNHALILERLYLRKQSRRAWRRYLDFDSESEWVEEAQAHFSALEQSAEDPVKVATEALRAGRFPEAREVVNRSPQPIRFHVENDLLPAWAHAVEQGDFQAAESSLSLAESLSSLLLEKSGDRLLADAITFIRSAAREALQVSAAGHRLYGEGAELFKDGKYEEAKERFYAAAQKLRRMGSPFVLWAQFNAALCDYQELRAHQAVNAALEIRRQAVETGALNLTGRIDWMTGLVQLEGADPASGLIHLRRALQTFQKTGEKSYEGAVTSIIANALTYLGEPDEAWSYHFPAIAATAQSGDEARLSAAYGSLTRSLLKKGQARVALAIQNEALALDIQDNPVRSSEAFWWRSMILRELGEPESALWDLEQARARCEAIPHEGTRNRNMAGLLVTEGAIRASLDPQSAVEMLTRALDLYKKSEYAYLLVDIYLERARALRRLSRTDAAEADLLAAIEEYEKQRGRVEGSRRRISFFSRADDVFDEMVDFQVEVRTDQERAFEFSERSRAREALDSADCQGKVDCVGRPLGSKEVLASIPAGTTLVHYHILHDRLLIWSLHAGGLSSYQMKIDRHELEALTERFLLAVQGTGGGERHDEVAGRLYRLLVEPVTRDLAASDRLAIVPDGILEALPFSALQEPRTGSYLIDRIPVASEPSSTLYIVAMQSAKERAPGNLTSLAIGNPTFDYTANPYQTDLPAAEREAGNLATRDPQSVLLSGTEATVDRFLQEVDRHDIVHFGGHAMVDRSVPGGSRLLLAPSQNQTGDLFGSQIQRLKLNRPKLVALSACNSGSGAYKGLEGISDLARPFLVAGAPSVVISLWPVEDRESEVFWKLFYDSYFAGHDAVTALRTAQLGMRNHITKSFHDPRAWAGYRLVGNF
jgi:CHAT domain-containing protein